MTYHKDSTTVPVDRVTRAMAALRFTGERTTNAWLAHLCRMKFTEAAAIHKLDASGYRVQHAWGQPVRFNRTDPRSVR